MFRSLFAYNDSKHNLIVDKDVTTAEFAIIVVLSFLYCLRELDKIGLHKKSV